MWASGVASVTWGGDSSFLCFVLLSAIVAGIVGVTLFKFYCSLLCFLCVLNDSCSKPLFM